MSVNVKYCYLDNSRIIIVIKCMGGINQYLNICSGLKTDEQA